MSCVCSKYYYTDKRDQVDKLKAYALDDTFHLETDRHGKCSGTVRTHTELTVTGAKDLVAQLNEFIKNNTGV